MEWKRNCTLCPSKAGVLAKYYGVAHTKAGLL